MASTYTHTGLHMRAYSYTPRHRTHEEIHLACIVLSSFPTESFWGTHDPGRQPQSLSHWIDEGADSFPQPPLSCSRACTLSLANKRCRGAKETIKHEHPFYLPPLLLCLPSPRLSKAVALLKHTMVCSGMLLLHPTEAEPKAQNG